MSKECYGVYDNKESDTFRPTEESRIHKDYPISKTLTTKDDSCCVIEDHNDGREREREKNSNLRIRKLSPLECCRLMGADDLVCERLKSAGLSDAQIYHIMGDGLIVQIPQKIIEEMIRKE